jgi:gluconolactonase
MPRVVTHDPRFGALTIGHAKIEQLFTGCRWTEGPAYFPAGKYLIWSDIPNDRLMRFDETDGSVSVFWAQCGNHNGHTRDGEGRLVSCEHRHRRVTRIEHDGSLTVLASHLDGKRLNSPNDVVVKSDGSVWFTDPTYGIDSDYEGDKAESEIGGSWLYRVNADGSGLAPVIKDRVKPNGLAFGPGEKELFVADTGRSHVPGLPATITAYAMGADGLPDGRSRLFATCPDGLYDGFRFDAAGNLWTSGGTSVLCYAPDGMLIGELEIGEIVGNLCFGGPKLNRLYICGQTSLYSLFLAVNGAR